jgi:hypothetical protein
LKDAKPDYDGYSRGGGIRDIGSVDVCLVSLDEAADTGNAQAGAQLLSTLTTAGPDAHSVPKAILAKWRTNNERLVRRQDGRMRLLKLLIRGKGAGLRGASDQLHAPQHFRLVRFGRCCCPARGDKFYEAGTRDAFRKGRDYVARLRRPPLVCGTSCHNTDIGQRLLWQAPAPCEPVQNARRSGVIGCRGEAEVAKLDPKVPQQLGGLSYRLDRVERILQTPQSGRPRHELSYSLRARAADGAGIEPALLPDQANEEIERDIVRVRRGYKGLAQDVGRRRRRNNVGAIGRGFGSVAQPVIGALRDLCMRVSEQEPKKKCRGGEAAHGGIS